VKKSLYVTQYALTEGFVPKIDLMKIDAFAHQDIPESNVKTVPVVHLLVTIMEFAQLTTMGLQCATVQRVIRVISVKQTCVLAKTVDMAIASSKEEHQNATAMMDGKEIIVIKRKGELQQRRHLRQQLRNPMTA